MSEQESQDWNELYRAAVVELDQRKLSIKIQMAHAAILRRITDLPRNANSREEKLALADALQTLQVLRREIA